MSQIVKNEDGTETELFTAEELAAKTRDELEAVTARAEEEKEALRLEKEAELTAAQEELAKERDKTRNFDITRRGKERADAKDGELAKTVEELQKQILAITSAPIAEAKDEFVKQNFEGKKEAQDKFEIYYAKLSAGVKTKAEAQAAMDLAFMLASDGHKPDSSRRMQAGSVNDDFAGGGGTTETEASKEFGARMGVSDEDKKKYGSGAKVDLIKPNVKA